MKKQSKKLLTGLALLVLMVTAFCFSVSAAETFTDGIYTYTVTDETAAITAVDKNASGKVEIPETLGGYPVTVIGSYSFQNCKLIESVTVPDSVTTIGVYAFSGCEKLISFSMGKGVKSVGTNAFNKCSITDFYINDLIAWLDIKFTGSWNYTNNPLDGVKNLYIDGEAVTDLIIPEGVTTINTYAFYGCNAIVSVTFPDSLTTIKEGAFYANGSLSEIKLGKNVTDVGDDAFSYCSSVSSIIFNEKLSNVHAEAFYGCYPDKVFIPDLYKYLQAGVKSPAYPLSGDKGNTELYVNGKIVENLVIPEGITEIKDSAFYGYGSIRSVRIPSHVKKIGNSAFLGCGNITSLVFEDGVTYIGKNAFNNIAVTELILPESLTSSGETAFAYIDNLTYLAIPKSYVIPSPDYSWQATVFQGSMDNISAVHYTGSEEEWNAIGEKARWPFNYKTIHYNCSYTEETSASCYQAGFTKGVYCNDCNGYAVGHKEIFGTGHVYEIKTQVPTCTMEGYDVHTCTVCGEAYTDNRTAALGHLFDEPFIKAATCTKRGYETGYCTVCRATSTQVLPIIPHSYNSVVTPDTCTANGKTVYTCVCGDTYSETIPTKGHDYQNAVCTRCGDDKSKDCSHMCHKSGFMGFIWKLVRFFQKISGKNPVCECGMAHY